ncbi:MAG: hypothetical protein FWC70_09295 [Defluviitaleaceae bacterium]|nr:hypothetical protein [Defluviitaleaceae bacterium]
MSVLCEENINITLRNATPRDIEALIHLRFDYLSEDGELSPEDVAAIKPPLEKYFAKHIADGTFIAIFAEAEGEIVSTAFLSITEKPASPSFITGKTGTILIIYAVKGGNNASQIYFQFFERYNIFKSLTYQVSKHYFAKILIVNNINHAKCPKPVGITDAPRIHKSYPIANKKSRRMCVSV